MSQSFKCAQNVPLNDSCKDIKTQFLKSSSSANVIIILTKPVKLPVILLPVLIL